MQTATQTSTELVQRLRKQMTAIRALPLMAVLSLFLLFAQAVEHGHSHDNLQAQYDCEVCLKIGSLEDAVVADAPSLDFPSTSQVFSILTENQTSFELTTPAARGPPSYT